MKKKIFYLILTIFSIGAICSCSKDKQMKIVAKNVNMNKETASIFVDSNLELVATISPKEAVDKSLVWSSSDETLATVNNNGVVKAIKGGIVEITATTTNHISTKCKVTITDKVIPCTEIKMNKVKASIVEESTLQLMATILPKESTDKSLVWTSSETSIATVDSKGLVKALKAGKTEIIATSSNDVKAKCILTITNKTIAVTKVLIHNKEKDLTVGKTLILRASVLPNNASIKDLVFISSSEDIATISNTGLISALKVGKVKITVKSELAKISTELELDIIPEDEVALKHIKDLKTSTYGWKAVYQGNCKKFGWFNYLFKFSDKQMYIATDMINSDKTGNYTYDLKKDIITMGPKSPLLNYDTYGIDTNNEDLNVDFTFNIVETTETSIKLVGVQFKTVLLLRKANAKDAEYINQCIAQSENIKTFIESNIDNKFFNILKITGASDKLIEVKFSFSKYLKDLRTMNITYIDGDNVISKTLKYVYTNKGFKLSENFEIEGNKISNFEYDETKKSYKLVETNGVEGTMYFSDERAFVRKGIALEFKAKTHKAFTMGNSTFATEIYNKGAACTFFAGTEIGLFIDYVKDGKTINSIMLQDKKDTRTIDVIWTIEGEDFIKASIVDQDAVDKMELTNGEKVIIDYYLKGFYILPCVPLLDYETYYLIAKGNSKMSLIVFIM